MKVLLLSVGFVLLQGCLGGLLSRDDLKAWRRFHSDDWATSKSDYEDGSKLARREDCEDDPEFDCQYLASFENYCKDQEVWTKKHCPAACGYCEGPSKAPAPLVCEDDPSYDCQGLASVKDYCQDQEDWTRKNCPLSCKWCGQITAKPVESTETPTSPQVTVEATTKQPAPPKVCEDKEGADCSDMSEEYCKDFEEDTRKNCPKSCGWCVVPTEEPQTTAKQPTTEEVETTKEATEAPTTPKACIEDTNLNCPRWSNKGYCITESAWMKERCFKSCGYCKEAKTSQRPTEERTTKAITTEQVPETSQKPTQPATERTTRAACQDKKDKCGVWSDKGQCRWAADWMKENCPKSCGHCEEFTEKPEENTTSKPTTSEACQLKTRHGYCCVFPFKSGGKEYTSCTTVDVGEPWCSLTDDFDASGSWDYCEGEPGEDTLEP